MTHRLLLLKLMGRDNTTSAEKAAVAKAHSDILKVLSVTDDKRPPAGKASEFRIALSELAFEVVYDHTPFMCRCHL